MIDNMSVSDQSQLTPSEIEVKKNEKIRQIARNGVLLHRKPTAVLVGFGCFINLLVGLSPLLYTTFINTGVEYCDKFKSAMNGDLELSEIP